VTLERIRHADTMFRLHDRDELRTRLAIYDDDGSLMRALDAPAHLTLAIEPRGATVTIEDRIAASHASIDLAPGGYVLVARAPGRTTVRIALLATSGDEKTLAFELPMEAAVPAGFVYVPPGDFLYGSRDDEPVRQFYGAPPMHVRRTNAYLIGQTEVTYAQWIEYLDTLPPKERTLRAPHVEGSQTIQNVGGVALARDGNGWKLAFTPTRDHVYEARAGESITYPDRVRRERQDWLRMPVSGITAEDAQAYAAWLDQTHRVPHARLCSEPEWERAARGADGRKYPHGTELAADDANIDITYGRKDGAFGPDEVGAHPATRSPFGLDDTAGNLWEIVRAESGAILMRGGSFYTNASTAVLANRSEVLTPTFRHVLTGVRLCADL
jgi:formylglycine-generating enzyme required for sulfatase activity